MDIPPLSIFEENCYKKHNIPELSVNDLNEIVNMNSVCIKSNINHNGISRVLFGLKSLFNHSREANIQTEPISSNYVFIFASKDIEKGEQLVYDYCGGLNDNERKVVLSKFGI